MLNNRIGHEPRTITTKAFHRLLSYRGFVIYLDSIYPGIKDHEWHYPTVGAAICTHGDKGVSGVAPTCDMLRKNIVQWLRSLSPLERLLVR